MPPRLRSILALASRFGLVGVRRKDVGHPGQRRQRRAIGLVDVLVVGLECHAVALDLSGIVAPADLAIERNLEELLSLRHGFFLRDLYPLVDLPELGREAADGILDYLDI